MPSQDNLVLERFFDDSGSMQLVLHSPFGSRLNRAWGLALRKRFCRKFNFELQAAATEDAIVLSLGPTHSFPLDDVFHYLNSKDRAPAFVSGVAGRADVEHSLALERDALAGGAAASRRQEDSGAVAAHGCGRFADCDLSRIRLPVRKISAAANARFPSHPLVDQTVKDCLEEAMDVDGLERLLTSIERNEKNLFARDVIEASPLAQEILNARPYAYLDDAPLEERRTRAVFQRRWLDPQTASDMGKLDQGAIDRVRDEVWPRAAKCRRAARCAG